MQAQTFLTFLDSTVFTSALLGDYTRAIIKHVNQVLVTVQTIVQFILTTFRTTRAVVQIRASVLIDRNKITQPFFAQEYLLAAVAFVAPAGYT
jgi:hypothetical protein